MLPIRAWLKVAHFQCVKVRQMVPVVVTVRPQRPSLSLSFLFFFYAINGAGGRSQTPSDKQQVSGEALDLSAGRLVNFSFFLLCLLRSLSIHLYVTQTTPLTVYFECVLVTHVNLIASYLSHVHA